MKKEGQKYNFTVEKLDNYYLSQVITANINSHKSCWQYVRLRLCDKMTLYLSGLPPNNL